MFPALGACLRLCKVTYFFVDVFYSRPDFVSCGAFCRIIVLAFAKWGGCLQVSHETGFLFVAPLVGEEAGERLDVVDRFLFGGHALRSKMGHRHNEVDSDAFITLTQSYYCAKQMYFC